MPAPPDLVKVPFVDFKAHVRAIRPEIDAAVARVLDSGWFILGPEGEAFEHELDAQAWSMAQPEFVATVQRIRARLAGSAPTDPT